MSATQENSILSSSADTAGRPVWKIDLKAIKQNCETLKTFSEVFFCPMVKADGYGHGLSPAVKTLLLAGVRQAGASEASEALQIREIAGGGLDILVFGPVLNSELLNRLYENRCILVATNWDDLKFWSKKPAPRLHVKFDTGFSRLGFPISESETLKKFFIERPHIKLEGVCSHLIAGERLGQKNNISSGQIKKMRRLVRLFATKNNHLFNTAGLLSQVCHEERMEFGSRPGIGLYGVKPEVFFANRQAQNKWAGVSLQGASSLKGFVRAVHQLNKGDTVSYDGIWKAKKPSVIVVVSLGYGDGLPRALSFPDGKSLFRGKVVPTAGRVCMDFFMADVSSVGGSIPALGEELVIFGEQNGAKILPEEQAKRALTVPHELFVRLGGRVQREYASPT